MKQRRKTYVRLAVFLFALLLSTSVLYGTVPERINYQGYLTDSMEKPVEGMVDMIFKLYNGSGIELWSEIHESVMVNNGIYNVMLGQIISLGELPFIQRIPRCSAWGYNGA